ncbi:MAG TPA: hypothetical protein V6C86_03140 [Oculatellaceae cyanobacterium]
MSSARKWSVRFFGTVLALMQWLLVFGEPISAGPSVNTKPTRIDLDAGLHEPFKHELQTKHFSLYSVSKSDAAKIYSEYLEDFLSWLNLHLVSIPPGWHLTIYLYPDAKTLNGEGCTRGPHRKMEGRFVQIRNAVYSYDECGIGTLTHELMHKVLHENFRELEPWAKEGIPTLFECVYGYKSSSGEPVIFLGFQNPWRLKELGVRLSHLTLAQISSPRAAEDPYEESDKRLLSTFLVSQSKLKEYFRLANAGEHQGYNTLLEATFRKPMTELEPDFKTFINSIVQNRAKLQELPPAQYFKDQSQFDAFCKEHSSALQSLPNAGVAKRSSI